MSLLDEIWYEKSLTSYVLRVPLYPFSLMFRFVSALRRSIYMSNQDKAKAPAIPVIVVGGLSAGGAGKTPLCVALLKELKNRGFKPGLLSRGYKSHVKHYPYLLSDKSDAQTSGDEPLLIYHQSECPVVVDPNRVRGAQFLYEQGVDVIVCDDGLQHYKLARDVEIAVLDGARMLGNRLLLPAGPLREGQWRLQTVDAVVVNGAVAKIGNYSMTLKPEFPKPLNENSVRSISQGAKVCALAGIGNPERFYKTVEDLGFKIVSTLKASDHERLNPSKIKKVAATMPVLMTRKDAVKYEKEELDNVFVIDVKANLSSQFYNLIENKIKASKDKILRRSKYYKPSAKKKEALVLESDQKVVSSFAQNAKQEDQSRENLKIFSKAQDTTPVSMFLNKESKPTFEEKIFKKADFDQEVASRFSKAPSVLLNDHVKDAHEELKDLKALVTPLSAESNKAEVKHKE